MQEALIEKPLVGAGKLTMVFAKMSAAVALAAYAFAASTGQAHAETLRWKLNPGEVLHYTMESKEVVTFNVQGKDKKSIRTSTANISWSVNSVSANGDAEITFRFDRFRLRVDESPLVPLEFDSSPNNKQIPDEFEGLDRQIKAMAGAEFTFKLRPNGAVEDLKIAEKTLKSFQNAAPQGSGGQGAGSEQALKEVLLQSSPPPFPAESVEPGKNWAAKPAKMPVPGLGTLTAEKVFTFEGQDSKKPALLQIGVESKLSLEPDENVTAKIRKQEGTGTLTFDAEHGRIVNTRNKQRVEIVASQRGQEMVQSTDTTATMTLDP
jgi:hypothetical protein